MQYKIPIITTNEGGITDIVKDSVNGFICERKDAVSIANSIEKLIIDKETSISLGNRNYELFNEIFTLNRFNNNIRVILHNVANAQE